MTIQHMEHVGIVVDDLVAATAFFVALGLKLQGKGSVEGGWVDRVVGLRASGRRSRCWRPRTGTVVSSWRSFTPRRAKTATAARQRTPRASAMSFAVHDIDTVVARLRARGAEFVGEVERYEDSYGLCYVRGAEGSSSSWRSRSAEGSGRPPASSPAAARDT